MNLFTNTYDIGIINWWLGNWRLCFQGTVFAEGVKSTCLIRH